MSGIQITLIGASVYFVGILSVVEVETERRYPNKHFLPSNALEPWAEFQVGVSDRHEDEGQVRDWFNVYDKDDLETIPVIEEYVPVVSMGTLLVLLTMEESDVFVEEDE